ncbi:hypothetical protein BH11MYX3_BH11MYX3_11750 [soil metagenome]
MCVSVPSVSAFKKAIQVLTTTVVKAEALEPDSAEFAALKAEGVSQLEQLLTTHAVLAAGAETEKVRMHENWFLQTVSRARELFGVAA